MLNWLQIGTSSVVIAAAAWALHSLDVYRIEDNHRVEIAEKEASYTKLCNEDKTLLEKSNVKLHKALSDNAARNARNKRMYPNKCVPTTDLASVPNSGGGYAGQDGIETDWLRDYAREANDYRAAIINFKEFKEEWEKLHGQP